MVIRVGTTKNDKELQDIMDNTYMRDQNFKVTQPLQFTTQSSAISWDEKGNLIAPETRSIECNCGKKIFIFLVQQPTKKEFQEDGKLPIWAGHCPRCKADHVRGERQTVENMSDKEWKKLAKLGHGKTRQFMHRRKRL